MTTQTAPITLYAYTFRSRAERVLWTLQELGLPFTLVRLDPFKGETLTPEFSRLNPLHKIPVLVHGDKVLTESLAIMEYLNDIAEGKLVPDGIDDYYRFRHLMYYLATEKVQHYLSRLNARPAFPEGMRSNGG